MVLTDPQIDQIKNKKISFYKFGSFNEKKKRILVTGGVGFIGYHLAKSLVSRGIKLIL